MGLGTGGAPAADNVEVAEDVLEWDWVLLDMAADQDMMDTSGLVTWRTLEKEQKDS